MERTEINATRVNGEKFLEIDLHKPEDLLQIDKIQQDWENSFQGDDFKTVTQVLEKKAPRALDCFRQTGRIVKGQYLVKNTPIIVSTQCIAGMW